MLLCISCSTKTRTPKRRLHATCLPLTPGAHNATSPSGFHGSRIHHGKFPWCRKPRNVEPDIQDLMPSVPPWIDGSRYFGKSQLAISRGIKLLYHKTPNTETLKLWIRATCPAMIDGSGRIGKSHFAISQSIKLLLYETPNAEPRSKGILRHVSLSGSTAHIDSENHDSGFLEVLNSRLTNPRTPKLRSSMGFDSPRLW
jgi:hypothetical protein